jgi:hypothetical protein
MDLIWVSMYGGCFDINVFSSGVSIRQHTASSVRAHDHTVLPRQVGVVRRGYRPSSTVLDARQQLHTRPVDPGLEQTRKSLSS